MRFIDTHCDALLKLQMAKRGFQQPKRLLNFKNDHELDTNLERLQQGGVQVQFFAIFIHPDVPTNEQWQHALEQIDLFYSEIIRKNPQIKHIKQWHEINNLKANQIGAVLTLEGAEAIGNDLVKLRHLYRLGVLSIGLTWNHANLCADGSEEPRGGGLTRLGKSVVDMNNKQMVFTDVSHLTVEGFWDVMKIAKYPFASHSNVRAICDHPRNLYDDQIKALIAHNGQIQLVFYPPFLVKDAEAVKLTDLFHHIDHICALGGEKHIGFGSDFDGISYFIEGLEDASKYELLRDELQKHYSEELVKGFVYQNFMNHLPDV
ncbi:dipeptidase [Oceanobacillus sp. 1P07AA]|uniref:dipeptidase n=1 Tax=Oceanobacillus sp. 1P07AA TaxID=3132293 RepID=UPI0039A437D7